MRLHSKLLGRFSARYMSRDSFMWSTRSYSQNKTSAGNQEFHCRTSQAAYTDIKHLTSGHQALLCCPTAQRYILSRNHLNCLCSELFYFFSNLLGGDKEEYSEVIYSSVSKLFFKSKNQTLLQKGDLWKMYSYLHKTSEKHLAFRQILY